MKIWEIYCLFIFELILLCIVVIILDQKGKVNEILSLKGIKNSGNNFNNDSFSSSFSDDDIAFDIVWKIYVICFWYSIFSFNKL